MPKSSRQRKLEAALIDAAGELARSGKYSFEQLVAKLGGVGFVGAEDFLRRPLLADALTRLCDAVRRKTRLLDQ